MTTATNEMFATRSGRPDTAPSVLLSVVSFLLGVKMRENLASHSAHLGEEFVARCL